MSGNNNESSSSFSLQVIFGPDDITTIKNVTKKDTVAHLMVKVLEERQNGNGSLPPDAELQLSLRGELLEDVFETVSALGITEKDSLHGQIITFAPCSDIEPGV